MWPGCHEPTILLMKRKQLSNQQNNILAVISLPESITLRLEIYCRKYGTYPINYLFTYISSSKYILIGLLINIYSSTPKIMSIGVYYIYLANVLDNKELHISDMVFYFLVSVPLIRSKHVWYMCFTQLREWVYIIIIWLVFV